MKTYDNKETEEMADQLGFYARNHLHHNPKDPKYLYCCPACGSGNGPNGTGGFSIMATSGKGFHPSFKCQACGISGDIFALAGILNNIDYEDDATFPRRKEIVAEALGYSKNESGDYLKTKEVLKREQEQKTKDAGDEALKKKAEAADWTEYYKERSQHIMEAKDFFRGVSPETMIAAGAGYDPEWVDPIQGSRYPSKRFIFPCKRNSYLAYDIRPKKEVSKKEEGFRRLAPKKTEKSLFLAELLQTNANPLFIVEGEWDALSILEVGKGKKHKGKEILTENSFPAVSVGGLSTYTTIIKALEEIKYNTSVPAFILAFDNDSNANTYKTAREREREIIDKLRENGKIAFSAFEEGSAYKSFFEKYNLKDANDAITNGEEIKRDFGNAILSLHIRANAEVQEKEKAKEKPEPPEQTEPAADPGQDQLSLAEISDQGSAQASPEQKPPQQPEQPGQNQAIDIFPASDYMASYSAHIADRATQKEIKTGFSLLDEYLEGGLHAGLYTVGAPSSLGKTALILQIADNVANPQDPTQEPHDVLYFSLEMGIDELIARSISRETFIITKGDKQLSKTTTGILNQARRFYTQKERDIIQTATENYKNGAAKHIYIIEGIGDISSEKIAQTVHSYKVKTGKTPLVIIDYLQLIKPFNEHLSDKQNIDHAVLDLKRLSRDEDLPVICISSFNRESYKEDNLDPVNLSNFKESGAIEYTSSVAIGLQYNGLDYKENEKAGERIDRLRNLKKDNKAKQNNGDPVEIQAIILKNRDGRKASVVFQAYLKYNYYGARLISSTATATKKAKDPEPTTPDQMDFLAALNGTPGINDIFPTD